MREVEASFQIFEPSISIDKNVKVTKQVLCDIDLVYNFEVKDNVPINVFTLTKKQRRE